MKFLKNIVITFGLLCGFIQANAMESTLNKVILGTWENRTDKDIQIFEYNPSLFRAVIPFLIIPAHTTIAINREIPASSSHSEGLLKVYKLQLESDLDIYELWCNHLIIANRLSVSLDSKLHSVSRETLNLSQFTEKINVIIKGIIEPDRKKSKVALFTKPVEVLSLKEQSMKTTIQKLKEDGKSLEEAQKIIPHDLHDLLLENWNQ